jgi:hypothetical protein
VAPRRALVTALVAGSLAAVAAGCGSRTAAYTAAGTADCLKKKGFTGVTTDPSKVGFIAAFSDHGGLFGRAPGGGNDLTIAFAADVADAAATEQEFRKHAPPKLRPHIGDVMQSQRNAVLVWTVSPSQGVLTVALGCLGS